MGRQASINLDDVKSAQQQLIAAGKPHGIIAIRRQIGRGSPQLITKLLAQINAEQSPQNPPSPASKDALSKPPSSLNRAWQNFSGEVASMLTHSQALNGPLHEGVQKNARLDTLEQLLTQQQRQLARLEAANKNLEEQLMHQQDLFDSWRHEQQAERQMLKSQFAQLSQLSVSKPAPRKKRKRGTQLDLYDDKQD